MATNYAFTEGVKLTIANGWTEPSDITGPQVWNTGLSAANQPHADEEATLAGKAIIPDTDAFEKAHDAQLRLWKTNQAVILHPGDSFVVEPKTAAEYVYYKDLDGVGFFKVTEAAGA